MRVIIVITALALLVPSCKKEQGKTRELSEIFEKISAAETYREASSFYTENTLAVVDSAVRRGRIGKDERVLLLPAFTSGASWEELEKKESRDSAVIRIRFTEHPVENMRGYEMSIRLVREDGSWKIDLAKELNESLQSGSRDAPEAYLNRLTEP